MNDLPKRSRTPDGSSASPVAVGDHLLLALELRGRHGMSRAVVESVEWVLAQEIITGNAEALPWRVSYRITSLELGELTGDALLDRDGRDARGQVIDIERAPASERHLNRNEQVMSTSPATRFLEHHPHGFSNIVEVSGGRLVFITGQMALNTAGELVGEGEWETQFEQVFENLQTQLAVVGADFTQVVKLTILAEQGFIENAQSFGEVRNRYINLDNPPASSIILTPKLVHPGALVDIAAIAHLTITE